MCLTMPQAPGCREPRDLHNHLNHIKSLDQNQKNDYLELYYFHLRINIICQFYLKINGHNEFKVGPSEFSDFYKDE